MAYLNEIEDEALHDYLVLLADQVGDRLETVWLFGSAARGDMKPEDSDIHSDIDILVVTAKPLSDDVIDDLTDLTYPIYLKCGRQISPAFKALAAWEGEGTESERRLFQRVRAEGHPVWPR